jgi:hypothetical protein
MSKILSGLYQIWRISPCLVPVVYEMKSLVVSLVGGGGGKRAVVGEDLLLLLLLRGVCGAAAVGEGRVLLQDRDKGGSVCITQSRCAENINGKTTKCSTEHYGMI